MKKTTYLLALFRFKCCLIISSNQIMSSCLSVWMYYNFLSFLFTVKGFVCWYFIKQIQRRTLGSDDLTIFKCFRVIFSLKKRIIQFSLSLNLYFQQKRALKLSVCYLPTKRSVWVFDVTNRRNGFSSFQSCHQVVMHLFNSLAKSCTLF